MFTKPLRYTLFALSVVLSFVAVAWLVLYKTEGLRLYSVQTDSMRPSLLPGDLVVDLKAQPSDIKAGAIVSYVSANGSGQITTHRVVANKPGNLITKGDNLAQPDPAVPYNMVIGKGQAVVPGAGYLLDQLHRPVLLIGLFYIPALFIAVAEAKRLARHFGRRPYQSDSGV